MACRGARVVGARRGVRLEQQRNAHDAAQLLQRLRVPRSGPKMKLLLSFFSYLRYLPALDDTVTRYLYIHQHNRLHILPIAFKCSLNEGNRPDIQKAIQIKTNTNLLATSLLKKAGS